MARGAGVYAYLMRTADFSKAHTGDATVPEARAATRNREAMARGDPDPGWRVVLKIGPMRNGARALAGAWRAKVRRTTMHKPGALRLTMERRIVHGIVLAHLRGLPVELRGATQAVLDELQQRYPRILRQEGPFTLRLAEGDHAAASSSSPTPTSEAAACSPHPTRTLPTMTP